MNNLPSDVRILNGLQGAADAEGVVIVIDVFRAFTVASLAVDRGASAIYPVAEIEDAFALAKEIKNSVLIGERHGKKLEGFDFGNSPTEISTADIAGRTIIHTTHAGTQGLWAVAENSRDVTHIFAASFANASATLSAVLATNPSIVSIVPLGWAGESPTMEDSLCAQYLAAHLTAPDEAPTWTPDDLVNRLKDASSSRRFFDPDQPWAPESDYHHCCEIDSAPHALLTERQDDQLLRLQPIV